MTQLAPEFMPQASFSTRYSSSSRPLGASSQPSTTPYSSDSRSNEGTFQSSSDAGVVSGTKGEGAESHAPPVSPHHPSALGQGATPQGGGSHNIVSGQMQGVGSNVGGKKSHDSGHSQGGSGAAGTVPLPLALEEWPVPFRDYFSRLAPSPVLWCYEALGEDLFGSPNQERSECLKGLIGKLRFPRGTSVFWPPSIPAVQDVVLSQRVLLQVLRELFPKLVILLGTGQTLSLFQGENLPSPFTQRVFQGHMVVFLPDFNDLMESASLFNQSVLYLRAIVGQLAIL